MNIFRFNPFPIIYASLPFIRRSQPAVFADAFDDLDMLHDLQDIARGRKCVSSMDDVIDINIKFELPDDILQRNGKSEEVLQWRLYYWKLYDIESLATKLRPAEAVSFNEAGIQQDLLDKLGRRISCLPILNNLAIVEGHLKNGYTLDKTIEKQLGLFESQVLATYDIQVAVGSIENKSNIADTAKRKSLPVSLRTKVLSLDHNRCIFCGRDATITSLEVNHIIPVSLIRKLNLDPSLIEAESNLCATCSDCNRGRSDSLTKQDLAFYLTKFDQPGHRNHDVTPFLRSLQLAQDSL